MKEKSNILVATDFSARADQVLEYCSAMARQKGYEIFLLHVFNPETLDRGVNAKQEEMNISLKLEKTAHEYSVKQGIEISPILVKGNIFRSITQTAREVNSMLIAMAMHRKSPIQELIGRFAFRIITASTLPVLLMHHKADFKGFDNILLPLDFMEKNQKKLAAARNFALEFNSTIHAMTVVEENGWLSNFRLRNAMNKTQDFFHKAGLQCETLILKKRFIPVFQCIVDYARKNELDGIFIMTRNEDDIDSFLVGSTSERIIENSEVPLITTSPRVKINENKKVFP